MIRNRLRTGRAGAWALAWLSMLGMGRVPVSAQVSAPIAADTPRVLDTTGTANSTGAVDAAPAGVENARRAWQNWTLNCQGCHRPDGSGTEGTAPSLAGTVARFLTVPGGREYLARVPGVATSPLSNADLAEVVNWMLWRFDREHLPAGFLPYTAEEMGRLRTAPLRMEAAQMRAALLAKADESHAP